MKTLPVSLFIIVLLPLVALPVSGEGHLISSPSETVEDGIDWFKSKLSDLSLGDMLQAMWDFILDKISDGIESISNAVINGLETLKGWHQSVLDTFIDTNSSWQVQTANVIFATLYILFIMGLIRVWVWALDVLPIV